MEARMMLVAAVAIAAAPLASADIMAAGPYAMDITEIRVCDDGEYPGMAISLMLVVDEETNETVYRGNFTTTYDFLCDECELVIIAFKWGSTGGWSQMYYLNYTKPFDYTKNNFPTIFDLLFDKMGIREKPVPAGNYYLHRFMPRGITMKSFSALPYGKYKVYAKALKDGETLCCLLAFSNVYEVESPKGVGFKRPY